MPEMSKCPNCRGSVYTTDAKCPWCGKRLSPAAPPHDGTPSTDRHEAAAPTPHKMANAASRYFHRLRYLLLPATFVLWYATAYYSLYVAMLGLVYIFSLSWVAMFFGYPFIIVLLATITVLVPGMLRLWTHKLYGFSRAIGAFHAVAGVIGISWFFLCYSQNPPLLVSGDREVFALVGMWQLSPLKTIFLFIPFWAVALLTIASSVVLPLTVPRAYVALLSAPQQ